MVKLRGVLGGLFCTTAILTSAPTLAQNTQISDQSASSGDAGVKTVDSAATVQDGSVIMVYGLKGARATELQRTPAAITAVNPDVVEKLQLLDLSDIGKLVPNTSFASTGSYATFPSFQIRGIGVALSTPTVDPSVTVAVDGMPYAYPVGTNIDTFDTESIEVMRGPQGVLQGRNSTGGVVSVRSRRPKDYTEAEFQATVGNYGRIDLGALIAGPIVPGALLGKLAVVRRSSNSFVKPGDGGSFVPAPGNPSGTNPVAGMDQKRDRESWLIRPTFVINPDGDLTVSLLGEYSKLNNYGLGGTLINPDGGAPTTVGTLYGYTPPEGDFTDSTDTNTHLVVSNWRGVADVQLKLPGVGVITSITGYREVDYDSDLDSDTTPFLIFGFPENSQSSSQFSQELRFASTFSNSIDLLIGGYYSNFDLDVIERRATAWRALGVDTDEIRYQQGISNQQEESSAIFGNISWHLTDRLTLSAGGAL